MTSLDDFLGKTQDVIHKAEAYDVALGMFSCQNIECDEVNTEADIDKVKNKLVWVCANGHKSSVAF
jgi:hypothetical protein